jgi:hypothetical protein
MTNRSKFVSMITDMGFDIHKPFDISSSGNENGVTLSVIIQGDRESYWRSDIRLAAIKHLIGTLDIKYGMDSNYDVFQKYMLTILDSIGSAIRWVSPYDDERNVEVVRKFIEHSLNSPILREAEQEGLIDQREDEDMDW